MFSLDTFLHAPVASILFLATIVISIMGFFNEGLVDKYAINPYDILRYKEYYRLLTAGFLHGNYIHLFLNMMTFYFFAFYLEEVIGSWQFGLFYMISMVLADIFTIFKHKDDSNFYSLGASGAISAVLLGVIISKPDLELSLFFTFDIPGWLIALIYIVYSYVASKIEKGNINHDAHLWGAISGILLTLLLKQDAYTIFIDWLAFKLA